nr:hypothetical protein [Tanacetum cinerariifolium]
MPVTRYETNDAMTPKSIQAMIDRAIQETLPIPKMMQAKVRVKDSEGMCNLHVGYAIDNKVKFATCTLLGAAITWWNYDVRNLGHHSVYAMTWGTLKKKLTNKYYPKELASMYTKFLADETEKVDKYISGLPDNIHRNVMSASPKTLDETIKLANDLMDQKLHTYAKRQNKNRRKADDSSRKNHNNPTRSKI